MKKIVVTTAVVNENNEVLLLQRSGAGSWEGRWNFPGGKFDPEDESLKSAAARETKEESSLDVFDLRFMGKISYKRMDLYVFFTDKFEGTVEINEESSQFKWVPLKELPEYKFPLDQTIHPKIYNTLVEEFGEE